MIGKSIIAPGLIIAFLRILRLFSFTGMKWAPNPSNLLGKNAINCKIKKLIIKIKTTKFCVTEVTRNNPPNIPIPFSMHGMCKLSKAKKVEYSNIIVVILLWDIVLSCLIVTAFINNIMQEDNINIK
uniref:Uncharacterized protein n=1 Tax=Dactylella sp. TaxID=1814903 RepID=A0A482DRF0_9PEZI|nr:hypothetical protein [Dactylella sp.]